MKPNIDKQHKRRLWIALSDGQWHLRKNINMENRMIRAVCQAEPDQFLSSQKGYKLVRYASDEEINESIADLMSRAKHMSERARGLERALTERQGQKVMNYG
jgi:hypothetical protein